MRIAIAASILCLSIAGLAAAAEVEAARRQTNIPAQGLGPALQTLAKERNLQVIYISEEVEKLRTRGASGELTSNEALTKLLDGTGFTYRYLDEKTVTILPAGRNGNPLPSVTVVTSQVITLPPPSTDRGIQLVQVDTQTETQARDEKTAAEKARKESGAANGESTEVRVTGSRIRRDPGEADVSPVTIYTREEIERSGAFTLADFIGRITQANNSVDERETTDFPASGRTKINLRGLGNNTTLILLNSRRLPKTGQGFGQDDYNLNGIPLQSIERIEVLTDSASALYGSDAIGGVVNIITREDYNGIDIVAQYGNTFDSDVSERNVNLTVGRNGTVRNRHYSFTLNLGTIDRNGLGAIDRPYTALGDYADSGGRPPQQSGPFSFESTTGAGSVFMPSSPFDPAPPNLPGLTVNRVAIPAGQDGRTLSIADFTVNSDPMLTSAADIPDYRMLMSPTTERTASLSASLDLNAHMQWFVEGSYFNYRSNFESVPPSADIPVPAANPFNPFGVDVIVSKVFYELGPSTSVFRNDSTRMATGLRGGFLSDWRYEAYADYNRYIGSGDTGTPGSINFYEEFVFIPPDDFEIRPTPGSAAIAETAPALALNVFGDGRTTTPNDIERLRAILGIDQYREKSETWTAAYQMDGTLMRLRSGDVKLAAGGEYRKEQVDFYKLNTVGRYFVSLDQGSKRDLMAAFAELSVPLVGERQNIPAVKNLQLSMAGRLDSESMFGEEFTPKVGLLWRPLTQLALRTTYSHGYKVPNLQQLFEPDETWETRYAPPYPIDPVTGQALSGWIPIRQGGNPELNAEQSRSWSAGVIFEPSSVRGLSVSVDYFDIDYTNKVTGFIGAQEILDYFPERVERDPVTNRVTLIDTRAINLATARAKGVDLRVMHRFDTQSHGSFDAQLNYTYNITNTQQNSPGSEESENVDLSYFPRVRGNAYLFWTYGGLEIGPTVNYESSTANMLYGGATAPLRIRHAIVTDLQGSYDFDVLGVSNHWTQGVKLTLGINNLFDRLPSATDGNGGYAKVDPRQRRYYLSLRKHF